MVAGKKLEELARYKELLRAQSDVHRCLIETEVQVATESLQWLAPVAKAARTVQPFAGLLAPVAGLLLARKGGKLLRWAASGLSVLRLVKSFFGR